MATIAAFPDGVNTAGPPIQILNRNPVDYKRRIERNEDGSVFVFVQPCGMLVFDLFYSGLDQADIEDLVAHFNLAKGKVNDFPFYARDSATTYNGARYLSFTVPRHQKIWSNEARIQIGVLL